MPTIPCATFTATKSLHEGSNSFSVNSQAWITHGAIKQLLTVTLCAPCSALLQYFTLDVLCNTDVKNPLKAETLLPRHSCSLHVWLLHPRLTSSVQHFSPASSLRYENQSVVIETALPACPLISSYWSVHCYTALHSIICERLHIVSHIRGCSSFTGYWSPMVMKVGDPNRLSDTNEELPNCLTSLLCCRTIIQHTSPESI